MKYSGIGGQAVIEGIMMKNGEDMAVGIRKPDGEIVVKKERYESFGKRHSWAKLPLIRGVVSFIESMALGMKTLMYSAEFIEDDEEAGEPSRVEAWLEKRLGDKLEGAVITFSVVLALIMALVIFMWFPLLISSLISKIIKNSVILSILEGIVRVAIFIIYIKIVSRTEDIKRTFMYHGAEHKCINCIEHGLPLTVENVAVSSRRHKRCGTSFIFLVMIISMVFFMVIRVDGVLMKLLSRLLLIPVIAGVSYEVLMAEGKRDDPLMDLISRPGLLMQDLTTAEPDNSMIEVAIKAVEAVFDWRAYEAENFPDISAEKDGPHAALAADSAKGSS